MARRVKSLLDVIAEDPELSAAYAEADLEFEVTEAIARAMKFRGMSQADLARKLGISRQAVSALLQGRNVSVRRVARVLHALGFRLRVSLEEAGHGSSPGKLPPPPRARPGATGTKKTGARATNTRKNTNGRATGKATRTKSRTRS